MEIFRKIVFVFFSLTAYVSLPAQEDVHSPLERCFVPPPEYADLYGDYRSPLVFYNGDTVKCAGEWAPRRTEIRARWDSLMGAWPPLLTEGRLEILDSVRQEGYVRHAVRLKWTPTEFTGGYLLVPDGAGEIPLPAVITVYYEPETSAGLNDNPNRDFALQLVRHGFIALSLGTSEATEARTYSLFWPDILHAEVQPLSMLACAASNALEALSKMPQVDPARIGIMGHSFGGKWAMFASCLCDKFACAVWSDPGIVFDDSRPDVNYWEPYYLGYHPPPWRTRGIANSENPARGLYPRLVEERYDLHELHALMAPRPFLVSGGTSDPPERWIPLNHSISVNRLLGYSGRVGMHNRQTHTPTAESNEIILLFFDNFLK